MVQGKESCGGLCFVCDREAFMHDVRRETLDDDTFHMALSTSLATHKVF